MVSGEANDGVFVCRLVEENPRKQRAPRKSHIRVTCKELSTDLE